MDVDKLFKLPVLPQSSVNKRKWAEPDASALKAARVSDEAEEHDADQSSRRSDGEAPPQADDGDDDQFEGVDEDDEGGRFFGGGLTAEQRHILELMNADDARASSTTPAEELKKLKRALLQLERAISHNQEMRAKFSDDPEKFIDSEVNLHQAIRSIVVVTTNPSLLYPELVKQKTTASLCGLLTHENVDIVATVIEVLEELTDDDVLDAGQQHLPTSSDTQSNAQKAIEDVVTDLVAHSLVKLLVQTLPRLETAGVDTSAAAQANAESDMATMFHLLSLIENLVSLQPGLVRTLIEHSFSSWLLRHLSPSNGFDQIKAYSAELLCIVLQAGSDEDVQARAKALVGTSNVTDVLLEALAPLLKSSSSKDEETREYFENLFDALCIVLSVDDGKDAFLKGEGAELMCLIMKQHVAYVRSGALKVIKHAVSGFPGTANSLRFVQCHGLRPLFDIWANERSASQDEDNVLEVIASFLNNLASDSKERRRLLAKIVSNDCQSIDRLVEKHFTTYARVRQAEEQFRRERGKDDIANSEQDNDVANDEWATELYIRKLDEGLFSLQNVDYILAWIIMEQDRAEEHVKLLFKRRSSSLDEIVATLKEYYHNVDEDLIVAPAIELSDDALRLTDVIVQLVNYLLAIM